MKKHTSTAAYGAALLLLLAGFSGCKKDELPISNTPAIKFLSISPNPAIKYQDEVSIEIEYTDGDGDLGENTPDVKNPFCDRQQKQCGERVSHQSAGANRFLPSLLPVS
jgi:hypothetical protein